MGSKSRWSRTAARIVGLALFVALVAVPTIGLAAVATVRGTVTNSAATNMAGIHVTIQGASLTSSYWADATTGRGGVYSFAVPAAGDYTVTVDDPAGVYLMDTHLVLGVTAGTVTSDFRVVRPGGFKGTVTSVATTGFPAVPIQQIEVTSLRIGGAFLYWDGTTLTDQNGTYAITGLFPAPHTAEFTDVSDRPEPFATATATVSVFQDGMTANINKALLSGTVLGGVVTDAVGGGALSATILKIASVTGVAHTAWIPTAANGTYRLAGIPAGTYTVTASSPTSTLQLAADYVSQTTTVTIVNNQVLTNVNFAMASVLPGRITGRVVGAPATPLAGIQVLLAMGTPADFTAASFRSLTTFSTVTTAGGTFSLPSHTGTMTVMFIDPSGAHSQLVTTTVAAGPAARGDFAMVAIGTITGTVTDVGAKPIAGTTVHLWNAFDAVPATGTPNGTASVAPIDTIKTGLNGSYAFGEVPAGSYRVSFDADGYQPEFYTNAQTFAGSTPIVVTTANSVASVVLSRPDTITGMVTGANGSPTVGISVAALHQSGTGLETAATDITDIGGGYTLTPLVSGDYVIRVGGALGGYVFPGGQWLTANLAQAAHFTFLDSLLPQTLVAFGGSAFDTVAPSVTSTFTAPGAFGTWISQPAIVTITATDAGSGVVLTNYTVDGGATKVYTAPFAITTPGAHVVSSWATDLLGNVSVPVTMAVGVIDAAAPTTTIALSAASAPTTVTLTAVDTSSGVASINYSIDGAATQLYTVPFSIAATSNPHTVAYWAIDNVGNSTPHIGKVIGALTAPTTIEETSTLISYGGTWNSFLSALYSGGSFKTARGRGAEFTITTTATTGIQLVALTGPSYGLAHVELDGVVMPDVDLYSATTKYKQVVFSKGGLVSGPHTLVVSWTGVKNPLATSDYINIDALGVNGTLTQALAPTIYEETSTLIPYTGVWKSFANAVYSGGTVKTGRGAGVGFTVNFTGTEIEWMGITSPAYGFAAVTIDGVAQPNVDLYSAATLYKQMVFTKTGLPAGPHTMVVTWTGLSNLLATGDYINIDAVGVIGTLN